MKFRNPFQSPIVRFISKEAESDKASESKDLDRMKAMVKKLQAILK